RLMLQERSSGVVVVLLGASLWGTIGTTYALIQERVAVDDVTLVTLRAAVIAVAWFAVHDRGAFTIRSSDRGPMVVFGLVSVTAFYLALVYAFRYSSVAVGTLLLYLAPALVTLGAALWFNEPLTRVKVGALLLSFTGLLLIVQVYRPSGLGIDWLGIAFGLAAAVTYGSYSLIGKPLMAHYRPATLLVWNLSIGAAGLLVIKLVVSPMSWPSLVESSGIALYTGLMLSVLPVGLYTVGLSRLPSSEASILATVEPVVAMVLATWLLDERLGPGQLIGAACIVGGVVLLTVSGRRLLGRWHAAWSRGAARRTARG
ncbi:MAG TPA: EamA family transporter, partial [Thermomicrobiales bacterium]|nr:EamA family transporter [Thermomicrobiales bacterium]